MKSEIWYVPWSKETGFLGCYCGYSKKQVIQDLESHYTKIGETWKTLRRRGMKIKKVKYVELKSKSKI